MSRTRTSKALLPWLSAKQDGKDKRFIQIGNSLLLSKRFQALSTGARQLYFCMANEAGGHQDVSFPHGAAKKYGFPKTSFDRYIKELQQQRFLIKIETGEYWQFTPNVYRFSIAWRINPAPHSGERMQ